MKRITFLSTILFLTIAIAANAQTTNRAITEHEPAVSKKDSLINADIILPAARASKPNAPDCSGLTKTITTRYDATTADRVVTKAKIYFYYNNDWPQFCAGIVHYTNTYELADDYKLLNTNAKMIAANSSDAGELKEALKWAKAAVAGDSGNEDYKGTVEALQEKVTP